MKCYHPSCTNTPLLMGLCVEHGCTRCGGVILADTEEWAKPLCYECWHALGDTESMITDDQAHMYPDIPVGARLTKVPQKHEGVSMGVKT